MIDSWGSHERWPMFLKVGPIALLALGMACGGEPKEPPRAPSRIAPLSSAASPPEPPAALAATVGDGGTLHAGQSPAATDPGASSTGVAPLPPTPRLWHGGGAPDDAALLAGDTAFDADDFALAESHYKEAAHLSPSDPAPLVGLARVAIAKTNVATDYNASPRNPALEKVATQLRQAVKLDPTFAPAHTELGRVLLILGKADEALATLRKAVELAPRDAEAHSGLGVAFLATGHSEEAVGSLAKAAELDPGSAPRQTNLGTALLMKGRVSDAIRAYEAAARIAPGDARTFGDLGTALLADNQVDKAIVALKRAVSLDEKRAPLHSNLGYAMQQKRDLEGAIAEYREALRLDEKLVSAWINLATALAQGGDRAEARKALERAQKIDPSDPRVRANLDELRELDKGGKSAAPGATKPPPREGRP